jgi:predicted alpha/beta-hydrolase family hydrolase
VAIGLPAGAPEFLLALTHGSGGTPDTADVLAVRDAGLALGAVTARVTQPYVVRGSRAPGSAARQDAAWVQIMEDLAGRHPGLAVVQAGRSNGARVVCRTALAVRARGVIALAFPLHPPGRPEKSRADELASTGTQVLVLNGDRDPFGMPDAGPGIRVVALPGQTHALSGNPAAIGEIASSWMREVLAG